MKCYERKFTQKWMGFASTVLGVTLTTLADGKWLMLTNQVSCSCYVLGCGCCECVFFSLQQKSRSGLGKLFQIFTQALFPKTYSYFNKNEQLNVYSFCIALWLVQGSDHCLLCGVCDKKKKNLKTEQSVSTL